MGKEQDFVEQWGEAFNRMYLELEIREEIIRMRAWHFHHSAVVRMMAAGLQHRLAGIAMFWAKKRFGLARSNENVSSTSRSTGSSRRSDRRMKVLPLRSMMIDDLSCVGGSDAARRAPEPNFCLCPLRSQSR